MPPGLTTARRRSRHTIDPMRRPNVQLTGVLRSWNEDRGFGFIAPTQGGAELFVHISAFPRDGSRPVEGESLSYELGRGQNGKPQAVRVVRQAFGTRSLGSPVMAAPPRRRTPWRLLAVVLVALAGIAYGYQRWGKSKSPSRAALAAPSLSQSPSPITYRCDGRTHCSQMTSCDEATYFLRNCPNVKMDGNNDGVPCEQQWCR
jgi:cold shock CspA family protein